MVLCDFLRNWAFLFDYFGGLNDIVRFYSLCCFNCFFGGILVFLLMLVCLFDILR